MQTTPNDVNNNIWAMAQGSSNDEINRLNDQNALLRAELDRVNAELDRVNGEVGYLRNKVQILWHNVQVGARETADLLRFIQRFQSRPHGVGIPTTPPGSPR